MLQIIVKRSMGTPWAILFLFFVFQPVQAFDYQQCIRDTQSRSPSMQHQLIVQACGAKARSSGQKRAVSESYSYKRSPFLDSSDVSGLMEDYTQSAGYKNHFTQTLNSQLHAGKLQVSIFSGSPHCESGYTPIRPTQGSTVWHQYYRRNSPHQQHHETIRYFRVKSVLCAKK